MGQQCSCLDNRRKYARRSSDDVEDEDELDILIDGSTGSPDTSMAVSNELDLLYLQRFQLEHAASASVLDGESTLLHPAAAHLATPYKMDEKFAAPADIQPPSTAFSRTPVGEMNASNLNEGHLDALHLYQKATGIVDEGELDLECVMCLDTFCADNPKVRSLCNCGMNRTNFHLSCLMEWLKRNSNCPVCRTYLFFEEP